MRRRNHRLPIPQHEFGFTPDTFNLIQDIVPNGERIAHERAEADEARRVSAAAQASFLTTENTSHD